MKWHSHVLAGLVTGLLSSAPVLAQKAPAGKSCKVPAPQIPAVDWRGQAHYQAIVTVEDGRIASIEVVPQTKGVEKRTQRSLAQSVTDAIITAKCQPGSYVEEHMFSFDLGTQSSEAAASKAGA
ncbi:hypothetical protein [Pelomonas cellulosilytica]|nr:hypothetical protein [Pelomonas sp. P8]